MLCDTNNRKPPLVGGDSSQSQVDIALTRNDSIIRKPSSSTASGSPAPSGDFAALNLAGFQVALEEPEEDDHCQEDKGGYHVASAEGLPSVAGQAADDKEADDHGNGDQNHAEWMGEDVAAQDGEGGGGGEGHAESKAEAKCPMPQDVDAGGGDGNRQPYPAFLDAV